MYKKLISLILAMFIIAGISGCSGSENTPADKSSTGGPDGSMQSVDASGGAFLYDEIEIGGNSGIKFPEGVRINSRNQLVVLEPGEDSNASFVTLDKDGKPVNEINYIAEGRPGPFDLDLSDNIYLILRQNTADSQMTQKLVVMDPAGKVLNTCDMGKFNMNGDIGKLPVIMDMAVDSRGNIYLATLSGIKVMDENGRELEKIGSDAYYSIDCDKEDNITAICLAAGKQIIEKINPSDGKVIWSTDISDSSNGRNFTYNSLKIRFDSSNNSFCLMNDTGVIRYDADGRQMEAVLDFKDYYILSSGNIISDLSIDSKGNFYITTMKENKFEIYRYDMEAGKRPAKSRKEITVAVPVSEKWLEIAAIKFQKENPDYAVKIKPYEQEYKYDGNYENYVRTLNTELLTGKGPDIFNISWLSAAKYIDKNLLTYIGALMERDGGFDDSSYYTNIFNALKYKGKLYTLPISVFFNVLAVDGGILEQESVVIDDGNWNWQNFADIGRKLTGNKNRDLFMALNCDTLLNYLLQGNYSSFLDINNKKAYFESTEFKELMLLAKEFGISDPANSVSYSQNYSDIDLIEKGAIVFNPQTFYDYTSYAFLSSIYKEGTRLLKYPGAGEDKGGIFNSSALFSINSNSKNQDIAWEFLKLLLSEEVQTEELGGFAVNKAALAKVADRAVEMTGSGGMAYAISSNGSDKPKIIKPRTLTQKDIDYINSFIENMRVYSSVNTQVRKIISEEAGAFFAGRKSAEDTAKLIQRKVELYLGE